MALSPLARIAGSPTPLYGLVFFVTLALATLLGLLKPPARRSTLPYWLALGGAAVSTGFTIYSVVALHTTCAWRVWPLTSSPAFWP